MEPLPVVQRVGTAHWECRIYAGITPPPHPQFSFSVTRCPRPNLFHFPFSVVLGSLNEAVEAAGRDGYDFRDG